MKLTAGINQTFHLHIRAVQQKPDERIIIVQFRISSDDNAGLPCRLGNSLLKWHPAPKNQQKSNRQFVYQSHFSL
jgi:hypothetical protein